MFEKISPSKAGISEKCIKEFVEALDHAGNNMHSFLMMRGDSVFAECYYAPYNRSSLQRMYSESKSLVAIAIGLLQDEGKLDINEPLYTYFPEKIDAELPDLFKAQTIRDNLMMRTAVECPKWFGEKDTDRVHLYFNESNVTKIPGTTWQYDSAGSQVLCALVEKLAGVPMLDYLRDKIFKDMNSFENAKYLKTPSGESWGDSGLLCTLRDMASFGRYLMKEGIINGYKTINRDYIRDAVSRLTDNSENGFADINATGYGYQIWRTDYNGYACFGMGNQLTICIPDKNFLFACTADDQGNPAANALMPLLFDKIVKNLDCCDVNENADLDNFLKSCSLRSIKANKTSPILSYINGRKFTCFDNACGISEFSLTFDGEIVTLSYTNASGHKKLNAGLNRNLYTKFPEEGYSDEVGNEFVFGHFYDCAASAAWILDNRLELNVAIIDKYLGNLTIFFGFKDNYCQVKLVKNAEAFLEEYKGCFMAKME